jgi:exodeoxyribonuclease V alpha subunit
LALLLENEKINKIALAAPTGKAAARLCDSIKKAKKKFICNDLIKSRIPEKASTIHRLLGSIPGSPYFRYNNDNKLPMDVVVVDEASMVDLALMSKLVQALSDNARLILLGDKDQLASVEAGSVLGDMCDTGNNHFYSKKFVNDLKAVLNYDGELFDQTTEKNGMNDCIVQLKKSYRFDDNSGIGRISKDTNNGNAKICIEHAKNQKFQDIKWVNLPSANNLIKKIKDVICQGYNDYLKTGQTVDECFQAFERFRVLCALREGPYGVNTINNMIEQILFKENLILPDRKMYRGRPVMITKNDYNLELFNGDIGLVLPDIDSKKELRIFFPTTDGSYRKFHPLRLSNYETVYAMTVHKSQGSEFDNVLLILPDKDSNVLTRELIYTGITRAKKYMEIWAKDNVFCHAVAKRIKRVSGLRDMLWEI